MQGETAPIIRFSEFLGIAYFGDENQHIVAPIFDLRSNAQRGWTKVTERNQQQVPAFHVVIVEHPAKYEFIAYPLEMMVDQINYAIYRSFSSLTSVHRFKSSYGGRTYIKFGWHDLTKAQKIDVLANFAVVDAVEFRYADEIKPGTLVDQIRKS